MPHIPKDAEWYVADLVVQIRIEKDPHLVIHINTVLVHAKSPLEAYRKAMKNGRLHDSSYKNPQNKLVTGRFVGLKQLMVIHDPLEDGSELFFEEQLATDRAAAKRMVSERSKLAVFHDTPRDGKPDYMPRSILRKMIKAGVGDPHKNRKIT